MANYYCNQKVLDIEGYEIYFTRFADSIINDHFSLAKVEVADILTRFYINESQIIAPGGGLSSITQALASTLNAYNWTKENIESSHHVRGKILNSESHEVDHYKSFEEGNIGIEIEWNNKDPFYDRDLENFRKLHQIGELSLGIIITRGASLQIELLAVYKRFLHSLEDKSGDAIINALSPLSDGTKFDIKRIMSLYPGDMLDRIAKLVYYSKYGAATTHMEKLLLRINRGVGNPCPLILIGIGKERLIVS